jgi:hypothetical protein
MRRLTPVVLGLVASLMGGGSRALAQADPPLVIFHAPDSTSAQARSSRQALEEVARRSATAVIDLSPRAPLPPTAGMELRRGIEAYRRFEYKTALAHLDKGIAEAATTGGLGLSPSELSDLLIYEALVFGQLGDTVRSWDDFVRAATIEPTRKLDPVRFSPRVIETFERAVEAVTKHRASLRVIAKAGCEAWVDSRSALVGEPAPLAPGEHYVRVTCDGSVLYGAKVLVHGEHQELRPTLDRPRAPTDVEVVAEALQRGAGSLLWCKLVASQRAGTTLTLRLLDSTTGKGSGTVVVRLTGEPGDRGAVSAAATRMIEQVTRPPEVLLPPPTRPTRWYKSPWLWAAVGVVVTSAVLLPFTVDSSRPVGFDIRVDYPR